MLRNLLLINSGLLLNFFDVTASVRLNILIFGVEYKPNGRISVIANIWSSGINDIEASVAFLKYFIILEIILI